MRDHDHTNRTRLNMARRGFIVAACALLASAPTTARAQTPPPPGYQPAPAPQPYPTGTYGQAAPGYGTPPVYYTTVPGGYESQAPGPRVLDWEPGQPLQPGYHAETRIRGTYVMSGDELVFTPSCVESAMRMAGATPSFDFGVEDDRGTMVIETAGMFGTTTIVLEGARR